MKALTAFPFGVSRLPLSEEVAQWARIKAAEGNTSVSRLIGNMLENQMRQSDDYSLAYQQWKTLPAMDIDAEHRMTREETHARR